MCDKRFPSDEVVETDVRMVVSMVAFVRAQNVRLGRGAARVQRGFKINYENCCVHAHAVYIKAPIFVHRFEVNCLRIKYTHINM